MKKFVSLSLEPTEVILFKPDGKIPHSFLKYGYTPFIVSYNEIKDLSYLNNVVLGLNVIKIKKYFNNRFVSGFLYLLKESKNIDILHFMFCTRMNLILSFLYKKINKIGKVYIACDLNDGCLEIFENSQNSKLKRKIEKYLYKKIDLISCESLFIQNEIVKNNYIPNIKYIPFGIDTPMPYIEFEKKENIILTCGRIGHFLKNNEMLIEAYISDPLIYENYDLHLIGPYSEEFKNYLDHRKLQNNLFKSKIKLIGPINDREDLYRYMSKCKIFIMTSRLESFCFAMWEAAACGCYIVSTDFSPAKDVTQNGTIGTLVKNEDIKELGGKLKKIIQNPSEMKGKASTCRNFVLENYSWSAVCDKAVKYLKIDEVGNGK